MRVDEHSLTDQVSSTASRAAESQRIQIDTASTAGSADASGADRVDLSSLAGRMAQALQSLTNQSAQRVSQLQKQYQAGALPARRAADRQRPGAVLNNMRKPDLRDLLAAAQTRIQGARALLARPRTCNPDECITLFREAQGYMEWLRDRLAQASPVSSDLRRSGRRAGR